MLRVEIGGLSVAYQRTGEGPVLVLLHGFTHDSGAWRPQLEGLSDEFTVIAWDAPGAGKSPDPPETFGMGDWADCLTVFLDAVGVQRAHILGLSWGGLLAQELYRRYAGLVRSLILADTYAGWIGSLPEPIPEQRLAACLRDASLPPAEFVPRYIPGMFSEAPTEEVREELARIMSDFHPLGFRLMATALARADTRDLLPTIRVPTLLVWGDADAVTADRRAPDARCDPRRKARGHLRRRTRQQPRSAGSIRCARPRLLSVCLDRVSAFKDDDFGGVRAPPQR